MENSKIFIFSAVDIHKRDDKRWQELFEICKLMLLTLLIKKMRHKFPMQSRVSKMV